MWRRWFVFPLILLLWGLTACGVTPSQDSQIVTSVLSEPKTFNYILSQESPNIFSYTYEGLTKEDYRTGEIIPALAESWQFSDDGLSLTFTLRPNLRWSDGEPLTVADVVFTYNDLILNEDIPTGLRDVLRVGRSGSLPQVRSLGNNQVEFRLEEPFAPFLQSTAIAILPAHILAPTVAEKDEEGNPRFLSTWTVTTKPEDLVVNGPYKLAEYRTSQRVKFTANPYYWGKDDQGNSLPKIKNIVWQIVESTDTALLQFRSGSLDALGVSPEYFSLLKKEEDRGKFTIYNGGPNYGQQFIAFNLNRGSMDGKPVVNPVKSRWFNNRNFRQAVAYAIDRPRMINNIYRGLGEAQKSSISVQSPFYDPTIPGYDYDRDRARELLLAGGFQYDQGGRLRDDAGNEVRFTLLTNAGNNLREALGSQIQQDLDRLGMQVDFTPIAFNVLIDRLDNTLDWDCHLIGLTGDNEPNNGANVWFPDGNLHLFNQRKDNLEGWQVADWEQEIGDLYIQAAQELDFEKRKALYSTIQRLVAEEVPLIHLVNSYALGAVRDRIQGVEFSALGGALWNIERLTLAE